jgi:hypothetical protein
VCNGIVRIDRAKTNLYTRRTRESPGTADLAVLASRLQDPELVLPFSGRAGPDWASEYKENERGSAPDRHTQDKIRRGGADDNAKGVEAIVLDGPGPGAGTGSVPGAGDSGSMGIWGKSTLSRLQGDEKSMCFALYPEVSARQIASVGTTRSSFPDAQSPH